MRLSSGQGVGWFSQSNSYDQYMVWACNSDICQTKVKSCALYKSAFTVMFTGSVLRCKYKSSWRIQGKFKDPTAIFLICSRYFTEILEYVFTFLVLCPKYIKFKKYSSSLRFKGFSSALGNENEIQGVFKEFIARILCFVVCVVVRSVNYPRIIFSFVSLPNYLYLFYCLSVVVTQSKTWLH